MLRMSYSSTENMLNNRLMFHVHREKPYQLNMLEKTKDFICDNETRLRIFERS